MDKEAVDNLHFIAEWMDYYDMFSAEPHESITNYDKQETSLECVGCDAVGVKRYSNAWEVEFEHEPDCKWVRFSRFVQGMVRGAVNGLRD